MAYVEGRGLDEMIRENPLPGKVAAEYMRKVAEAIHYAHEKGVVHRDLKPSNILTDKKDQPRITDFGLAKRAGSDSDLTATGQILGTPGYMPPEQALGEQSQIGPQSDVYALGAVLYHLTTGRPPFVADSTAATLLQVLEQEPVAARQLNPQIDHDLETICLKCIEKEAGRRYVSAEHLADDLACYLRGEPIRARPIGKAAKAWRWCRRNPRLSTLSTAAVLLLVAIAVVGMVGYISTNRALRLAERREGEVRAEKEKADAAARNERLARENEREQRRLAEETLIDMYTSSGIIASKTSRPFESVAWFGAASARSEEDPGRRRANAARLQTWCDSIPTPVRAFYKDKRPNSFRFDATGNYFLIHYGRSENQLWDLERNVELNLPNAKEISCFIWHPTEPVLVTASSTGMIQVRQVPEMKTIAEIQAKDLVNRMAFSRDGNRLAIAGRYVQVYEGPEYQLMARSNPQPGLARRLVFSPVADMVACLASDHRVRVYDLKQPSVSLSPLFPPPTVRSGKTICLLGHPARLVAVSDNREVSVWDIPSGEKQHILRFGQDTIYDIRPSPDAAHLAIYGFMNVELWHVTCSTARSGDSGPFKWAFAGHRNHVEDAVFSPDGRSLLTVSEDRTAWLWPATQAGIRAVAGSDQRAYQGFRVDKVWDRAHFVIPHEDEVVSAAFSPRGTHFATGQTDGLVRVWKLPDENREPEIPIDTSDARARISPDGRYTAALGWSRDRHLRKTRVHEIASGEPAGPYLRARGYYNDGVFSPDGETLVTLSSLQTGTGQTHGSSLPWAKQPGQITFWDWRTGTQPHYPIQTASEPIEADFSPDGNLLVVACAAGQILVIDPHTGRLIKELRHPGTASGNYGFKPVRRVAFAPDGSCFLTVGFGSSTRIWLAAEPWQPRDIKVGGLTRFVSFSPDSRQIAIVHDHHVSLFDVRSAQQVGELPRHPDWVFSALFSPDGNHVLTSCRDHMARLWNRHTGKLACPALEHEDEVFHACFASNGKVILTAGREGGAQIWDPITGREIGPHRKVGGFAQHIAATRDGDHAVVSGKFSYLKAIDLQSLQPASDLNADPHHLCSLGEIVSGRRVEQSGTTNLTSAEWYERWLAFRQAHPDYHGVAGFGRADDERSDELFRLGKDIRYVERSDVNSQRRIVETVKACLQKIGDRELSALEYSTLYNVVDALQASGRRELLVEACNTFAPIVARSSNPLRRRTAETWQGVVRRSQLAGEPLTLRGTTIEKKRFDIAKLAGKPVAVVFWTSSYGTLDSQLPCLKKAVSLYEDRGLAVVTINADMTRKACMQAWQEQPLPWPTLYDEDVSFGGQRASIYLGITEFPAVLLVDREGNVAGGAPDRTRLETLLKKQMGPPFVPKGTLVPLNIESKANQRLTEKLHNEPGNSLEELPQGDQTFAGVKFAITDDVLQLSGRHLRGRPRSITAIPANVSATHLYFLHSAGWEVPRGTVPGHDTTKGSRGAAGRSSKSGCSALML